MEKLSSFLEKKEIKFIPADTLFDLAWGNLKLGRCPYPSCSRKLHFPLKGDYAFCSNPKKHKKTFVVNKNKL